MNAHRNRLIVASFIFSILAAGASIAALVLRILNDQTGINLSYFLPGCSAVYATAKFNYAYRSILIAFIANCVAIASSLLVFMLLVCPLKAVVKSKPP
jgi:hypothetical protein